jgi:hypothetical protein
MTATPARLDLTIGVVRRVRQNFVRRVRVRTLGGYRVERIPDHRLIGYELLRNPSGCGGSWRLELRSTFASGVKRSPQDVTCTSAG